MFFQIWNELARLAGDEKAQGTSLMKASVDRLRGLLLKVQAKSNMKEYDGEYLFTSYMSGYNMLTLM